MPTETDRAMSDDDVIALLTDDEREWFPSDGPWNIPHGNCMKRERRWLLRLAAERRTVRELRAVVSGKTIHDVLPPQCESMSVAGDRCIKSAGHDGRHERMTMR